jgi:hypothetical protein
MATGLGGRRHERCDQLPFFIGYVAAIAKVVAVVPRSRFGRPHRGIQEKGNFSLDSIGLQKFKTQLCVSRRSLRYGRDFNHLYPLPLTVNGATVDPNSIWSALDSDPFIFAGSWDTDARLCLQAQSPRPCTILAAVIGMQTSERT